MAQPQKGACNPVRWAGHLPKSNAETQMNHTELYLKKLAYPERGFLSAMICGRNQTKRLPVTEISYRGDTLANRNKII